MAGGPGAVVAAGVMGWSSRRFVLQHSNRPNTRGPATIPSPSGRTFIRNPFPLVGVWTGDIANRRSETWWTHRGVTLAPNPGGQPCRGTRCRSCRSAWNSSPWPPPRGPTSGSSAAATASARRPPTSGSTGSAPAAPPPWPTARAAPPPPPTARAGAERGGPGAPAPRRAPRLGQQPHSSALPAPGRGAPRRASRQHHHRDPPPPRPTRPGPDASGGLHPVRARRPQSALADGLQGALRHPLGPLPPADRPRRPLAVQPRPLRLSRRGRRARPGPTWRRCSAATGCPSGCSATTAAPGARPARGSGTRPWGSGCCGWASA